jgi:hypothetical protein
MYIVKVLKRKDAASVTVAIYLAMALIQSLYMPVYQLSDKLSRIGVEQGDNWQGAGWRSAYLGPFIQLILLVVVLEILIRLFVWAHPLFVRKRK